MLQKNTPRLEDLYRSKVRGELKQDLTLHNVMEVPRLVKVVLNVGVKDADTKGLQSVVDILSEIAGQRAVRTVARKSIAGFKLRAGMAIGVKVTLRRARMYVFLDKLFNLALPKTKDYHGVPRSFDGRGNYNLGIREWLIFPEVTYEVGEKIRGMNVTIQTTSKTDVQAYELLKSMGLSFKKV